MQETLRERHSTRAPSASFGRTGRVVAEPLIFAPRPALPRWLCRSHSIVRPSPRSSNYGENGDGSTEPQVASWRPCATVDVSAGAARALRRLQQHVLQVAEQWHGAGAQHSCVGRWGRISIDQIASVTQHPTLIRSVLGYFSPKIWANYGFYVQKRVARRRGPSNRPSDEQIQGERVTLYIGQHRRRVRSASLVYLERPSSRSSTGSSRTGPLGAGLDALGGRRRLHAPAARTGPRAVSPPTRELTALVVAYALLEVPRRVRDLGLMSSGQIT